MIAEHLTRVAQEGLVLALWLTAPVVVASTCAGFATSVLQAATQIQESSLTFPPRLVAAAGALALAGPWILDQLLRFARAVLQTIAWVG